MKETGWNWKELMEETRSIMGRAIGRNLGRTEKEQRVEL